MRFNRLITLLLLSATINVAGFVSGIRAEEKKDAFKSTSQIIKDLESYQGHPCTGLDATTTLVITKLRRLCGVNDETDQRYLNERHQLENCLSEPFLFTEMEWTEFERDFDQAQQSHGEDMVPYCTLLSECRLPKDLSKSSATDCPDQLLTMTSPIHRQPQMPPERVRSTSHEDILEQAEADPCDGVDPYLSLSVLRDACGIDITRDITYFQAYVSQIIACPNDSFGVTVVALSEDGPLKSSLAALDEFGSKKADICHLAEGVFFPTGTDGQPLPFITPELGPALEKALLIGHPISIESLLEQFTFLKP